MDEEVYKIELEKLHDNMRVILTVCAAGEHSGLRGSAMDITKALMVSAAMALQQGKVSEEDFMMASRLAYGSARAFITAANELPISTDTIN